MKKLLKKLMLVLGMVVLFGVQSAYALPIIMETRNLLSAGPVYGFALGSVTPSTTETWAVAQIGSVTVGGNSIFDLNSGYQLVVVATGFKDVMVTNVADPTPNDLTQIEQRLYGSFGTVKVYKVASGTFDYNALVNTSASTVYSNFITSVESTGELWLSATLAPDSYLSEKLTNHSLGYAGNMSLDIIGGSAAGLFQQSADGYDAFYSFSATLLQPNDPHNPGYEQGWAAMDNGTVTGTSVPEPASLLLLGLGLFGLGIARRYRKN